MQFCAHYLRNRHCIYYSPDLFWKSITANNTKQSSTFSFLFSLFFSCNTFFLTNAFPFSFPLLSNLRFSRSACSTVDAIFSGVSNNSRRLCSSCACIFSVMLLNIDELFLIKNEMVKMKWQCLHELLDGSNSDKIERSSEVVFGLLIFDWLGSDWYSFRTVASWFGKCSVCKKGWSVTKEEAQSWNI